MDASAVPEALQERLGLDATVGLLALFDVTRREWRAEVISLSVERFERRLVEEVATLRVEMARGHAALRQEIVQGDAAVRQGMTEGFAALRQEMTQGLAASRQETTQGLAALRQDMERGYAALREDMAGGRVELIKWSFLFWIGQVLAMSGILGMMLRFGRP